MNENINLCEILKDCPKGTKLYSSVLGEVKFDKINLTSDCPIRVIYDSSYIIKGSANFTKEGKFLLTAKGECVLFPSKEQRDWSKWKCTTKFDPKTLKVFDRVIVWDEINAEWFCANYSHRKKSNIFIAATTCGNYLRCIPYNDDTNHLVGTKDEAPEYYRYWED